MKLNEIQSSMKVDLIVSSINKLIEKGVMVHLVTFDGQGKMMRGKVVELKRMSGQNHLPFEMGYVERRRDGVFDDTLDGTRVSDWEVENATLEKNADGTYLFTLPNEEMPSSRLKKKDES